MAGSKVIPPTLAEVIAGTQSIAAGKLRQYFSGRVVDAATLDAFTAAFVAGQQSGIDIATEVIARRNEAQS